MRARCGSRRSRGSDPRHRGRARRRQSALRSVPLRRRGDGRPLMSAHVIYHACTDCYIAHHYGATEVDGAWFAVDSDVAADPEPLALIPRHHYVTDAMRDG